MKSNIIFTLLKFQKIFQVFLYTLDKAYNNESTRTRIIRCCIPIPVSKNNEYDFWQIINQFQRKLIQKIYVTDAEVNKVTRF